VPGPPTASASSGTGIDAAAGAITVAAAALDWTLPAQRQIDVHDDLPDVLLVVDCIYHPALVRPLLETMTALAIR
jgi:hypothetical protein